MMDALVLGDEKLLHIVLVLNCKHFCFRNPKDLTYNNENIRNIYYLESKLFKNHFFFISFKIIMISSLWNSFLYEF